MSRRRFLGVAAGLGVVGAGVACGGSDDDAATDDDDDELSRSDERRTTTAVAKATATAHAKRDARATVEPTTAAASDAITLSSLLQKIPNTDANRDTVTLNHYGRAAAAGGLTSYPTRGADSPAVIAFATTLVNAGLAPADISGYRQLQNLEYWRYEIGFSFEQIEADAYAGSGSSLQQVLLGEFSLDDIEVAVTTDPTWSPVLARQEYQGVKYYSWGAELAIDPKRISTVHPLGRGDRMAPRENRIFWTPKDASMAELISTEGGKSNSLEKTSALDLLVHAFEVRYAHVLSMTTNGSRFRGQSSSNEPQVEPFEAICMGATGDGRSYSVLVGLAYGSRAAAEKNAPLLESRLTKGTSVRMNKPWSQVFDGPNTFAVDNNVIIAELPTKTPAIWRDIFNGGDSLVVARP